MEINRLRIDRSGGSVQGRGGEGTQTLTKASWGCQVRLKFP